MADEVLFFATPTDFQAWLVKNHDTVDEQWVGSGELRLAPCRFESDKDREEKMIEAHDLTSLVEVAEGAIVSRVLARSAGGSMTLFAFDEGQELSEHHERPSPEVIESLARSLYASARDHWMTNRDKVARDE